MNIGDGLRRRSEVALVVLAWAVVVVPRVLQSLTAPKHKTSVGGLDSIPYSGIASTIERGLSACLLGLCVLIVAAHLGDIPLRGRGGVVVLLSPWVYMVVRDLYLGVSPTRPDAVYPAVVVALWLVRPRLTTLRHLGTLVGLTAILSLVMGAALPAKGIYHAASGDLLAADKQILPWGLLVGPFTDSNNLGQFLVLGLPAVLLARRRRTAVLLGGATCFALLWAASRSSLAAAAVVLVAGAVLLVARGPGRRALSSTALLLAGGAVVALPLVTSSPTAFSNRGHIWTVSLQAFRTSPVFGLGSGWYSAVARRDSPLGSSAFHGHNQFVHVLVTGGLVYGAVLAVLGVLLGVRAGTWARRGHAFPTLHLTALLVSCALEVSFGAVDRDFLLAVTVVPMAISLFAVPPAAGAGPPPPRSSGEPTGLVPAREREPLGQVLR